MLPHPWAKGAEILIVGWVFTFGLLYVLGYAVTTAPGHLDPSVDDGVPRWLQTLPHRRASTT